MKPISYLTNKTTPTRYRSLGGMIFVLLFVSFFALSPYSAYAQCGQWDVGGQWSIQQSTTVVNFELQRNGSVVTGKAYYTQPGRETKFLGVVTSGGDSVVHYGDVDGSARGSLFTVHIYWDNHKSIGVYTGKISPSGKIEGDAYGEENPSVKVKWYSRSSMLCAPVPVVATKTPTPAPPKKTIKATGHARVTPPDPAIEPIKAILKAPGIIATPNNIALMKGKSKGMTTLTWDAGRAHPSAEVWVKVDDGDETKVVATGKGTLQVTVVPGKSYLYILKDAGKTLATLIVEFHR